MANGVTKVFEANEQEQTEKWVKKMQKIPKYPEKLIEKDEDGKIVASVWN